jgi:hypothetical protein
LDNYLLIGKIFIYKILKWASNKINKTKYVCCTYNDIDVAMISHLQRAFCVRIFQLVIPTALVKISVLSTK